MCIYTYTLTYIYMCIYTYMYILYICIHTHIYTYIYLYICIRIYIYIYTYIHICTYIYVYTFGQSYEKANTIQTERTSGESSTPQSRLSCHVSHDSYVIESCRPYSYANESSFVCK